MKRIIFLIISLLFIQQLAFSQVFGNEWISYQQRYYSFPIVEDGIYRIQYNDLVNAGIPITTLSSSQLQIFGKEQEVPLKVVDGGDNQMNPGDYIEFFAEKNRGWLDSLMYDNVEDIGNPEYSLYSDTLYYFLTWTTGATKRVFQETDVNYSIYQPIPYVLEKIKVSYSDRYYGGVSESSTYRADYSPGEGWGGINYNGASGYNLTIPFATKNIYLGSGAPLIEFHAKSNANSNANFSGSGNHHLRWEIGGGYQLYDEIFIGYRPTVVNQTFPVSELTEGTTNIQFRIIGDQGATTDYQSINYLHLVYPRTTNDTRNYIDWTLLNSQTQAKIRIAMNNANLSNPIAYVFRKGSVREIPFVDNGGSWEGLIPNSSISNKQRLIISDASLVKNVKNLKPVNQTGFFHDYSQENVERAYIILYNKVMQKSVNQYKSYRTSAAGGSHNVILCEVNDAWMQYGGGIPKHVLGSKRALHHIHYMATDKPLALFIAGKGITEVSAPNTSTTSIPRKSASIAARNLVPSYGYPSSDILLTAGWDNATIFSPLIPTGRIAARDDDELLLYLNKVKIFEAAQDQNAIYNKPLKDWQKQILHFGGGGDASSQSMLKSYLQGMQQIIEDAEFGGNVTSYYKTTTEPFNPVQSSEVNDRIRDGVSIMTFFGHSSAEGFDQNVDDPSNWGNAGKYPMVIGNGCYSGNIFQSSNTSSSENFVLTENLGAIGFISSSEVGYASYLNMYSSELYRQIGYKKYGNTIGAQVKGTIQQLESQSINFLVAATSEQMILHADPEIRINWHQKPEIDLTLQDISFGPQNISLSTDSIYISVILTNLGRSIVDTFDLTIRRHFPNSTIDSIYNLSINGLDYKDTILFKMLLQASISAGINEFTIQADIPSFIPEQYDEYGNNEVRANFFIDINGIMPVWPYNYAVVPTDSVVVKASTINPIAPFNTYRFEIDTTDLYNSPFKRYAIVSGLGGIKEVFPNEWKSASTNSPFPLVLTDSMVCYWRVSVDSSVYKWNEYSFQYIPDKWGWGQSHFFQYKNNSFQNVEYDRDVRKRKFKKQDAVLTGKVYNHANTNFEYYSTLWQLNGQDVDYALCQTTPSLHVGVVDPATFEPWGTAYNGINADHNFGNVNNESNCRNQVEHYFIFRQNSTAQLQAFENMILNGIPDGHYVIVYTTRTAEYSNWQTYYPQLFNTFQSLGATGMSPTTPDNAFIFIFKKGDPTDASTLHGQFPKEYLELKHTFEGNVDSGIETSTIIGPAQEWKTVYWRQTPEEFPSKDTTILKIRGLDANLNVGIEIDTAFTSRDSILYLDNLIPASSYPYLQLQAWYYDSTTFTPAQVRRWHVLFDHVPEAAIDGTNGYTLLPNHPESMQEGVDMAFAIDVKNISDLPMDSLLVHYWINDKNQVKHTIHYPRTDSLRVEQVIRDTVHFSTVGLAGNNVLWMEVNPYVKGPNNELKDQPELAHFNNILQLPFSLSQDDINPILDVTFDGEHILNGDIVGPNAEIVISLQDENPFLVMNSDADTSNFGIYLTRPNGQQKRVPFVDAQGNQNLYWIPANSSNLRFKIIYDGDFEESGKYELLVQGSDKAGNLSGKIEYRIKFEVILESSITHLMNYPNPFSTKTHFVFTLTGADLPDDMMIQIMTVTGRVVREITMDELGPIKIGRNITEYAWDGRDEFGDQLANGVYLYHVVARINNEEIKHRSSGADQYFKKNWGKMYLMR